MRRLLLIVVVLGIVLTPCRVGALEDKQPSKPPIPTNGQKQQDKSDGEKTDREQVQATPFKTMIAVQGPITVVRQLSPAEEAKEAKEQSKTVWQKFKDDVLFMPQQWINVGLLIFAGIAAGYSYKAYSASRRQVDIANEQLVLATSPRLYVGGVRVIDLEVGKPALFFVKFVNAGPVAAENVIVSVKVEPVPGFGGATYSRETHTIMIPANDSREYPIRLGTNLRAESLDLFKRYGSEPLRVTGYFEYKEKRTEYCYQYCWFGDQKVEGLPDFFPCDFDLRRNILIKAKAPAEVVAETKIGAVVIGEKPEQPK